MLLASRWRFRLEIILLILVSCNVEIGMGAILYCIARQFTVLFWIIQASVSICYMYARHFLISPFPLLFCSVLFSLNTNVVCKHLNSSSDKHSLPKNTNYVCEYLDSIMDRNPLPKDHKWCMLPSEYECGRTLPANYDSSWMTHVEAWCLRGLAFWSYRFFFFCVKGALQCTISGIRRAECAASLFL